jgi:hypothetical protein
MAEWKKVIVSGSNAELHQITSSGGFLGNIVGNVTGNVTGDVTGNADTATVATTVTITDNENTNENNPIVFVAGGDLNGGNLGLETDGTATYNPSSGKITATGFVGDLTGTADQVGSALTAGAGLNNGGGTFNGATTRTFSVDSGSMVAYYSSSIFSTISGDVTITAGGVATVTGAAVADGSITNAKLANMAANTVKVRHANDAGVPSDFEVGDTQLLIGDGTGFTAAALSGDVTMTNGGVVTLGTVGADHITEISNLTADEGAQLENIGSVTISNTQWGYLGAMNQGVTTTSDVNFNDLTLAGDLTVNGTTTTLSTTNLSIEDKFITVASGSQSATDGGFIVSKQADGAGFAVGYDTATTRWVFDNDLAVDANGIVADAYLGVVSSSAEAPIANPIYGGATGYGNMHIKTDTGDIYIFA